MVLVGMALVALVGFAALAVDVGFAWGARRRMQTAADAGALAGAVASRQSQSATNVTTAAYDATSLNGFTNGTSNVTVTPTYPYSGGSCSSNCIKVAVSQPQPTYFLRVLGLSSLNVSASAVAGTTNSGGCISGLGPTSPSFTVTGTPSITASCGVLVNTDAHCGGNFTLNAPFGVEGNAQNCPTATQIGATPDPFAYLGCSTSSCMPTCSGHSSQTINNGQNVTLTQGSYCGGITVHNGATVTFSSGTYNLGSGGLSTTGGTISGTGVTFISTGAISFTGNPTVNLSATTSDTDVTLSSGGSADIKGILFWDTSTSTSKITGGAGSTFDGTLYFPQSELDYSGNSSNSGYTIIAADSIKFTGTTTLGDNYSSLAGGKSPIESSSLFQ